MRLADESVAQGKWLACVCYRSGGRKHYVYAGHHDTQEAAAKAVKAMAAQLLALAETSARRRAAGSSGQSAGIAPVASGKQMARAESSSTTGLDMLADAAAAAAASTNPAAQPSAMHVSASVLQCMWRDAQVQAAAAAQAAMAQVQAVAAARLQEECEARARLEREVQQLRGMLMGAETGAVAAAAYVGDGGVGNVQ
jgi:hypothetical protein